MGLVLTPTSDGHGAGGSAGRWIQYSVPDHGGRWIHVAASSQEQTAFRTVTPFELHGFREGDAQIIVLAGELDLATVGELCLAIDVAEVTSARIIVVDLSMLEFIDSSGVHGIVDAGRRLAGRLVLVSGPPPVHRVFELSGLADRVAFQAERPRSAEPARPGASRPARGARRDSIVGSTGPTLGLRGGGGLGDVPARP